MLRLWFSLRSSRAFSRTVSPTHRIRGQPESNSCGERDHLGNDPRHARCRENQEHDSYHHAEDPKQRPRYRPKFYLALGQPGATPALAGDRSEKGHKSGSAENGQRREDTGDPAENDRDETANQEEEHCNG